MASKKNRVALVTEIGKQMELRNEWERKHLTGGRLVLAELDAIKQGYVKAGSGLADMYLDDAMRLIRKFVAISDIVRNPGGMDEPGGITVEDILNENAEVQMEDNGWQLLTHRTPEEIAKLRAEMETDCENNDGGDSE